MLLKAPAKINLTLKILSKRADGYHEVSSLMRAIRLFDEVQISLETGSCDDGGMETGASFACAPEIRVSTDVADVPDGPGNLAYRAVERAIALWGGETRIPLEVIDITLKKHIPSAAGLAGGSTDAAAVLLGLAKELAPGVEIAQIAYAGTALGADVPFCVYACAAANPALRYFGASAALASGIGDRISPLPVDDHTKVLLLKPRIEVPTPQVYTLYDARKMPDSTSSDNDLEAPCVEFFPIVGETLEALKALCREEYAEDIKVQLSGSGPTIFAYFEGADESCALRVYTRAKAAFPDMFVCLTETL